jgi:hypothetical protein
MTDAWQMRAPETPTAQLNAADGLPDTEPA